MGISRRGFVLGTAAVAALGASVQPLAAHAATLMQVSTAKTDITPVIGYPMAGYGTNGPRRALGVNEPLIARCTVLWDNGYPNVIVTADVLGFGRSMHQQIRNGVGGLGVASADFVLNATHTHNGPVLIEKLHPYISYKIEDLAEIEAYSSSLVTKIVSLVQTALSAPRTTCSLEYYVLDENFSFNREGLSYQERDVPTLVARDLNGSPRAVLFSYGAHTVAAGNQQLFDPDYPSEAIKTIEGAFSGAFAQFVLGPAGDQNPATQSGFLGSDAYGYDLGLTIVNEIRSPGRTVTGPISTAYSEVSLPLDISTDDANLATVASMFDARHNNTALPGYYRRHGEIMAAQARNNTFATSVPLPIQRWRFGGAPGLTMVFCGGEIVSGYAAYFRARNGGSGQFWFSGYANEVPAYIPSDELLDHACYAGGWDSDYPGIAGGSMTVYGYLGHFKGRPGGVGPDGVEQILIGAIQSIL